VSLTLLRSGVASVQDAGRAGFQHLGVSAAGFADAPAARLANALLGNSEGAPLIEIVQSALHIRFDCDSAFALCGAPVAAQLQGDPCPLGMPVFAPAGSILHIGKFLYGRYAYLAIAGGINMPQILGSASTDINAGFGALLRAGDQLQCATSSYFEARKAGIGSFCRTSYETPIRFVPNNIELAQQLQAQRWSISPQSNRMGMRLEGVRLTDVPPSSASAAVCAGIIQVPPSGLPIVLGVDAQTTGGYPIAGCVISADLARLYQHSSAHQALQFAACTLAMAQDLARKAEFTMQRARFGIADLRAGY
jgi:5-oxoprolinase (ATP-hydrolysing) subunit C